MHKHRVRILLADSQDIVRAGLRTMLEKRADWCVCAEAGNGKDAVRLAALSNPDVVILDIQMTDLDGADVTRQIKRRRPQTEILVLTMHDDESRIREVLAAGARAFVLKSEGASKLLQAVDSISRHNPFFAPPAAETLLKSFLLTDVKIDASPRLTTRQVEIVRLLTTGSSNKEVAAALGISIKTVETHRAAIMRRLGFRSIANLVRYAVRERVIKA